MVEAWYCVGFVRNKETLAIQNLERQRYRVYCPRFEKTVSHARTTKRKLAVLFPGYLFVQLDIESQRWRPIDGTVGVTQIVKVAGSPARVDPGFMDKLHAASGADSVVAFGDALEVGDQVRVIGGAMDNQIASLCRMVDHERMVVLMAMLGRTVEVTIPRRHLIKAA